MGSQLHPPVHFQRLTTILETAERSKSVTAGLSFPRGRARDWDSNREGFRERELIANGKWQGGVHRMQKGLEFRGSVASQSLALDCIPDEAQGYNLITEASELWVWGQPFTPLYQSAIAREGNSWELLAMPSMPSSGERESVQAEWIWVNDDISSVHLKGKGIHLQPRTIF